VSPTPSHFFARWSRWWWGLLVLVLLWWAWHLQWAAAPHSGVDPAAAVGQGQLQGTGHPHDHLPPRERASPGAAGSPTLAPAALGQRPVLPAATGPASGVAERVWDLCGLGRMPWPAAQEASKPPEHVMGPSVLSAQQGVLASLEAGSPRQRAVAAQLRRHLAGAPVPVRPIALTWLELSRLAPQDAVLQAWTVAACGGQQECPGLGAATQAWLRLEPRNAAAWLGHVMAEPQQSEAAFVAMAEGADHWNSHVRAFLVEALGALPFDAPGYIQVELMRWMQRGMESFSLLNLSLLTRRCQPPALSLSGRPLWCERVGELLQGSADALIERRLGEVMQERAGRTSPQNSDFRALSAAREEALLPPPQPWSCTAQAALADRMQALARLGEVGAAIKWRSAREGAGAGQGARHE
jgi:hypothetical protein